MKFHFTYRSDIGYTLDTFYPHLYQFGMIHAAVNVVSMITQKAPLLTFH